MVDEELAADLEFKQRENTSFDKSANKGQGPTPQNLRNKQYDDYLNSVRVPHSGQAFPNSKFPDHGPHE